MAKKKPKQASHDINIFEKAICYSVDLKAPGSSRRVKADQIGDDDDSLIRTDADPDEIKVSKDILTSEEYKAIKNHDAETRKYVKTIALKSILKNGIYLLAIDTLEDVDEHVHTRLGTRRKLIKSFFKAYPDIVAAKKKTLRSLFDPSEFPEPERLARKFKEHVEIFDFGVPGTLRNISRKLFEREKHKTEAMWKEAQGEIIQGIRVGLLKLIKRASSSLAVKDDGKKRQFRKSLVEEIQQFLEMFDKRNIFNDDELSKLVKQAKRIIGDNPPAAVVKQAGSNEFYRAAMQNEFAKLEGQLGTLVEESETRKITL